MIKVFFAVNFVWMSFQKRKDQLIEENPSVFKKVVEEVVDVFGGDNRGKKAKYPLAGENVRPNVTLS